MSCKFINKNFFSALFLLSCFSVASVAQSKTNYEIVTEGQGVGNIKVGISTKDDVIANYGSDFKFSAFGYWKYEMFYEKFRLTFSYCQADPKGEIFLVEIIPPYKVKTDKGIILGESAREDVLSLYDYSDSNYKNDILSVYPGIEFIYTNNLVSAIRIFEKEGLRQCDTKFPKK